MYNLAYQMSTMPQNLEARYKADWAQWTNLHAAPPNTYGNTSALVNALNYRRPAQAQQGYNSAYVQVQSYPSGNYSSLDSTHPGHRRQPVRHSEIGADNDNQYALPRWARSARLSRRSQPSSPTSNRIPFRPTPASRPRLPCSARSTPPRCCRFTRSRTPTRFSLASIQQAARSPEAADRRAEPRHQQRRSTSSRTSRTPCRT